MKILKLALKSVGSFPDDLLSPLIGLGELNLSKMQLTESLGAGLFQNNPKLENFTFSGDGMQRSPENIFQGQLARPTLSQFWSFKIRHTTFLNCIQFADLLITRL